uniref:Uncharacterized protein n=1 Tax=Brassica oleracea TaxID=3712 RepID=A0A3P6F380_BRAOL|nr:unnamed protein product [Brassica oleracea]
MKRIGPSSGIIVVQHQGISVDRHFLISSTASSRELDRSLFSKMGITSDLTFWSIFFWF